MGSINVGDSSRIVGQKNKYEDRCECCEAILLQITYFTNSSGLFHKRLIRGSVNNNLTSFFFSLWNMLLSQYTIFLFSTTFHLYTIVYTPFVSQNSWYFEIFKWAISIKQCGRTVPPTLQQWFRKLFRIYSRGILHQGWGMDAERLPDLYLLE